MSGGVDSAVAAHTLKSKGCSVVAVHMSNWDLQDEKDSDCTSNLDLEVTQRVCTHLDIPLEQVSFVNDYWNLVFEDLLDNYSRGLTPNPDVLCNRFIKFDKLFEYARERLGAEYLATGHFAKLSSDGQGHPSLEVPKDTYKDQTYFLSRVDPKVLEHVLFPIAELTKEQVRSIAKDLGLPNAERRSSAGICMVGPRKFQDFMNNYLECSSAEIVTETGSTIGTCDAPELLTIGQNAKMQSQKEKMYVVNKDLKRRLVMVCKGRHNDKLYSSRLIVSQASWISEPPPMPEYPSSARHRLNIRARHQQPLVPAYIRRVPGSQLKFLMASSATGAVDVKEWEKEDEYLEVQLSDPMRAPAEGQTIAFYHGNVCLGGGCIMRVIDRPKIPKQVSEEETNRIKLEKMYRRKEFVTKKKIQRAGLDGPGANWNTMKFGTPKKKKATMKQKKIETWGQEEEHETERAGQDGPDWDTMDFGTPR